MKKERRKFSAAFKAEVALEAIHGVLTVSELAQKYEVHPVQIAQWKKEVLSRASTLFEDNKKQRSEMSNMQNERDELFKQLGELKFQNEWLKKKLL
jgi:transposase